MRKKFNRMSYDGNAAYTRELPPHGPKLTLPDDTLSIKEILAKHVRGMDMNAEFRSAVDEEGQDFDSPDLEKLGKADLFDQQQYIESVNDQKAVLERKLRLRDKKLAKERSLKEAQEKAELEAFRKQQERQQKDPVKGG